MGRLRLLDEFYEALAHLSRSVGGPRTLAEVDGRKGWPRRGVYFFFEPGEFREDGDQARVVRVGTHALRPSRSTLWKRLAQHRGTVGGAFAGGGNHRGSVFRLHIGDALVASGRFRAQVPATWGVGSVATAEVRRAEHPLECAVSSYLRDMPFLWVGVDDPPTPSSDRGVIEAGAIAALSNHARPPIDSPSSGWLGRHSTRRAIRESGLWNINHIRKAGDRAFLPALRWHVRRIGT